MLYQIQNMFKPTPAKYKAQSELILDVFTETTKSLTEINTDIVALKTENQQKIDKLLADQVELTVTHEKNDKIVKKLEAFLND